jgi:hypothetical protein
MSALGQTQTCAAQKAMSALRRIATAKSGFAQKVMSALPLKADMCGATRIRQKRTSRRLLDHLIRTSNERVGNVDAECLGGFEIYDQLDFRSLLNW